MEKIQIFGTISGSFRKFWDDIKKIISEFEKRDIRILSPKISKVSQSKDEFVYLNHDKSNPIEIIEKKHLLCISQSDFLFIVNPQGYVGISTSLEIGYALSKGIKVYALEEPTDSLLKTILISNLTIPEIIEDIKENKLSKTNLDEKISNLQMYFSKKVIERGFDNETEKDLLILLLEEIGELSHIIRTFSGLKIKKETLNKKKKLNLEGELADIFIYILILANKFGINLYDSLRKKEIENEKREWVVFTPDSNS